MSKTGYKDAQIGPKTTSIPEHWEVKHLEEIFDLHAGGDIKDHQYSETQDKDHPYPIYTNSTEDNGLYGYCSEFEYPEGSITITGRGDLGHALYRGEKFNAAVRLVVLTPSKDIDSRFFAYYINGNVNFPRESTGVPQLTRPQVAKTEVCYPSLPEQRRIADIISTVDEEIHQTDEIIKKRGELRQGLLQKLFHHGVFEHERKLDPEELADKAGGVNTGMDQTTIGQIPEEWETERLGELTESSSYGINASAEEFDPEKPRYLRITDIAADGHLKEDDPKSISWDASEGYKLEPGDLVFARTGATVGKTLLYQDGHPEAAYAGYLIRFQLDQTRILPKFAFYFTQTDNYDRWVTRVTRQGAQENINTGEYCSILLPLPSIVEQQEIVSILETVDQKIKQERKTKQSLEDLKRGLTQDLLTGKVRVNTD